MNRTNGVQGMDGWSCPYCRGETKLKYTIPPHPFLYCTHCGLHFRARRPDEVSRLLQYYETRYYDRDAHDQLSGQRDRIYADILDILDKEHPDRGDLLDVGCGCGIFLGMAQQRGWRVAGVDLSQKSVDHARLLLGDKVSRAGIADYNPHRSFDAVTAINVLDHLAAPWHDLRKIRRLMKGGGHILLRFTNGAFHPPLIRLFLALGLMNRMGKYLVYHEFSFSPGFMRRMLSDLHFTDVQVMGAKTADTGHSWERRLTTYAYKIVSRLSNQRWVWTPSLLATAKKGHGITETPVLWA